MFDKAKAIINIPEILQKGKLVASPVAWKTGQITAGVISGLLGSVVVACRAFGYEIPLSDDQIVNIGSSVVVIVGLFWTPVITIASTDKIGFNTKK